MGCKWAFASFLGRRLRCAVATRVRATSSSMEAASRMRGGGAASGRLSIVAVLWRAATELPARASRAAPTLLQGPVPLRKRAVGPKPPLGSAYSGAFCRESARWLETRPSQECSRRPRHPSMTPTSTARRPREGEPARLSHVPCVSHSVPTARRESAVFTRQGLRRGRCRAAGTADAPPGLPPQRFYPLARLPTSTPSQRPLQSRPTPNKHPCPSK